VKVARSDDALKNWREMLLADLRLKGCTCQPNIIPDGPVARGAITNVRIEHDDWCPLLQRIEAAWN
jgi:hypothetical protein